LELAAIHPPKYNTGRGDASYMPTTYLLYAYYMRPISVLFGVEKLDTLS